MDSSRIIRSIVDSLNWGYLRFLFSQERNAMAESSLGVFSFRNRGFFSSDFFSKLRVFHKIAATNFYLNSKFLSDLQNSKYSQGFYFASHFFLGQKFLRTTSDSGFSPPIVVGSGLAHTNFLELEAGS